MTSNGKTWDGKTLKGSPVARRIVENPVFSEIEDSLGGVEAKVAGSGYAGSGALTITVSGAGSTPARIFTVRDVILNTRTGERMKVDTVASDTTITIASAGRAYGTTPAAAGIVNDTLLIIGNTNDQFSKMRNINNTRATKIDNYVQILKTTFGVAGQEKVSKLYGGPDLAHQRAKKGIEHQRLVERTCFFGEKKSTTGDTGNPEYATGGIQEGIEGQGAYVQDQAGQPWTVPDIQVFLQESFYYGNVTKTLFTGNRGLSAVQQPSLGQLQTSVNDKTYGVKINTWVSPHGDIEVVQNPEFRSAYQGYAFLLDLDCFRYVTMPGRDVRLETNIQDNSADGEVDQFTQDFGLERVGLARCSEVKNIL